MRLISARNVHVALPMGIDLLLREGVQRESRNGSVVVQPMPVTTCYTHPQERVILWRLRDANPFFHLFEALWMLAGRDDIAFVAQFVKRMRQFSDDGITQPGAYGKRWRKHFIDNSEPGGFENDQLDWAVQRLRNNPNDRRVVISMWDAQLDPFRADMNSRDVPCNLVACPAISTEGRLDLTVFCRSNDIIWGAYGANAVHFSVLQEYLAARIDVPIGCYWQISNNFHAYEATLEPIRELANVAPDGFRTIQDPYAEKRCEVSPLFNNGVPSGAWDVDLALFFADPFSNGFRHRFFRRIAKPMWAAHQAYRHKQYGAAFAAIEQMPEKSDWRIACTEWLRQRKATT